MDKLKKEIMDEFDEVYKQATGEQNIVGDQILKDFIDRIINRIRKTEKNG